MTTPATGKLAWGQAGNYDAHDDRGVITAVTAGRLGLVRPVRVQAGAGLQILISGGWVGVASCDDFTSAVVGTTDDMVVEAIPGPASGSRQDVVWCQTNADEGTFQLQVMPRTATAGLSGIPLVNIIAGQGANLASQMNITSVDASVERRVLSVTYMGAQAGAGRDYQATVYGAAVGRGVESLPCWIETGQWYRVRYYVACASILAVPSPGTMEGRIGIGQRTDPGGVWTMMRGAVLNFPGPNVPSFASIDYVFRHSLTDNPLTRLFDGRIWTNGGPATIRPGALTDVGQYVQTLTVEDIGS
jgi:hypothetical protein